MKGEAIQFVKHSPLHKSVHVKVSAVQEPCGHLVQTPACDVKEKEGAGTKGKVVLCWLEIRRKDVLRACDDQGWGTPGGGP